MGLELVVGYLAAWAWLKARRVAGRADTEVDAALDAGMNRLHEMIAAKLAADPALEQLEIHAGADLDQVTIPDRTRERVRLSLEDAVEADTVFAARLEELVAELRAAQETSGTGPPAGVVASGERAVAVGGDISGIVATGGHAVNTQETMSHADEPVAPPQETT